MCVYVQRGAVRCVLMCVYGYIDEYLTYKTERGALESKTGYPRLYRDEYLTYIDTDRSHAMHVDTDTRYGYVDEYNDTDASNT